MLLEARFRRRLACTVSSTTLHRRAAKKAPAKKAVAKKAAKKAVKKAPAKKVDLRLPISIPPKM